MVEIDPAVERGLVGIAASHEIIVLTWFHLAAGDVPNCMRAATRKSLAGVFATPRQIAVLACIWPAAC